MASVSPVKKAVVPIEDKKRLLARLARVEGTAPRHSEDDL